MPDDLRPADSLIDLLPEAAAILDTDRDRLVSANDKARRLLALGPDGDVSFLSLMQSETDMARLIDFIEEASHRGEAWTRDLAMRSASGAEIACELRARALPDRPGRYLLLFLDLAELERHLRDAETAWLQRGGLSQWTQAQSFFAELERQNQLILNAAGEGIYGVNADGKTTFVNRAAQEMLGWTTEDLLGRDIHSMIHHHHLSGEVYPSHDCPIYQSFRFEKINRIEDEVFWRKDGKPIRVEYVSTPIYDQQVLAGAVVIFRDITERKESERKLHEAMTQVAELRDRLEQENAYLQQTIISERAHHDIVGDTPAIRQIQTKIALVAPTSANVLISGEPGTGKALVASAIHKESERRRRPLIHVRCGSLSRDMIEAELFGQVRGGFAGATRDRPGMVELAHNGTLFLDDVDELPPEVQGKLLDALQKREVVRVGDIRGRHIDVRVIASARGDIAAAVANGRFRKDLYFFLNVFPVECPALRDRKEDVPRIAAHLLTLACKRLNRDVPIVTEGVMQRLTAYDWPGNVRELRNVIERAAIVSTGGKLIVDVGADRDPRPVTQIMTEAEIEEMQRANLVAALRETRGRVSGAGGAAALLGVPATTLYSRVRKFAITPEDWGG